MVEKTDTGYAAAARAERDALARADGLKNVTKGGVIARNTLVTNANDIQVEQGLAAINGLGLGTCEMTVIATQMLGYVLATMEAADAPFIMEAFGMLIRDTETLCRAETPGGELLGTPAASRA